MSSTSSQQVSDLSQQRRNQCLVRLHALLQPVLRVLHRAERTHPALCPLHSQVQSPLRARLNKLLLLRKCKCTTTSEPDKTLGQAGKTVQSAEAVEAAQPAQRGLVRDLVETVASIPDSWVNALLLVSFFVKLFFLLFP